MQLMTAWLILLMSIIGHTEFWVIVVNRLYGLRIQPVRLRMFRAIHDVSVICYPLVLLWLAGFGETSLIRGGRFADQPESLKVLLMVTAAGCIPFLYGVLRWQFVRRSQYFQRDLGQRIDVEQAAKADSSLKDIRGPRRHHSQLWPLNEIYWLEVNTKSVRMNRSSASPLTRRPLRLVHFSDLHVIGCPGADYFRFMIRQAENLRADAFVFTGDLIDDVDLLHLAVEILNPLTKLAPCFFVLGNHDWRFDYEQIRAQLEASGWKCVAGNPLIVSLGDRRVLFAGTEMPWMGSATPSGDEPGCDLSVLLSHSPDQHPVARRSGYDLMLAGHTHGGQVVLPVIGPIFSPSLFGVSFAAGLFQLGPLTLHVTRGIGAKDPMRWNCCPELTCLEIDC